MESEQETELAFSIADRFISIQEVDGGYDYSIMGADYKEIDGGIYDNPDVTIREALHDILEDLKSQPDYNGAKGNIQREDELIPMDYDGLMEKQRKQIVLFRRVHQAVWWQILRQRPGNYSTILVK